jgi:hypothetical protein
MSLVCTERHGRVWWAEFGGTWLAAGFGPFWRSCGAPLPTTVRISACILSAFSSTKYGILLYSTDTGLVRRNGRIHGHSRHTGIETKELQQLCPGQAAMR